MVKFCDSFFVMLQSWALYNLG